MGRISKEFHSVWEYFLAVAKYWWLIIVGLGLTVLDFVERLLGTWWIVPPVVWLAVGVACATLAQYLAYRDLRKSSDQRISEREISLHVENEALRQGTEQLDRQIERLRSEQDSEIARIRNETSREINQLKKRTPS